MAASDALSPQQKYEAYRRWKQTGHQTPGIGFSAYLGGSGSYRDWDDDDGMPRTRSEIVGRSPGFPQGPGIPDTEYDSYGDEGGDGGE